MKKRITITIDQEDFDWIKRECFNISPLMNSLLKKHISMKKTTIHTNSKTAEQEAEELINAPRTD